MYGVWTLESLLLLVLQQIALWELMKDCLHLTHVYVCSYIFCGTKRTSQNSCLGHSPETNRALISGLLDLTGNHHQNKLWCMLESLQYELELSEISAVPT